MSRLKGGVRALAFARTDMVGAAVAVMVHEVAAEKVTKGQPDGTFLVVPEALLQAWMREDDGGKELMTKEHTVEMSKTAKLLFWHGFRRGLKRCARAVGWLSLGFVGLTCLYIGWALTHPIPECRSRDSEWKVWCLFGHRDAIFQWEERSRDEEEND